MVRFHNDSCRTSIFGNQRRLSTRGNREPSGVDRWTRNMADMNSFLRKFLVNCKETDNNISGYVDGAEEYSSIKSSLKSLGYKFSVRSSRKLTKKDDNNRVILIQYTSIALPVTFFGFPFVIEKSILLQCSEGPQRRGTKKIDSPCEELSDHVNPKKKRIRLSGTKKKNCPATMSVRCIKYFPDFAIDESIKRNGREKIYMKLKYALKSEEQPRSILRFYIFASKQECHIHSIKCIDSTNIITQGIQNSVPLEEAVSINDQRSEVPIIIDDCKNEAEVNFFLHMVQEETTDGTYIITQEIQNSVPLEETVSINDQRSEVPIIIDDCKNEAEVKFLQHMVQEETQTISDGTYLITDKLVLEKLLSSQKEMVNFIQSNLPTYDGLPLGCDNSMKEKANVDNITLYRVTN